MQQQKQKFKLKYFENIYKMKNKTIFSVSLKRNMKTYIKHTTQQSKLNAKPKSNNKNNPNNQQTTTTT